MKNWKRTLALLLSLAMALSLFACGSADGDETETASPDVETSLDPNAEPTIDVDLSQDAMTFSAGLSGDEVLLTVNGEEIPADLFLYWLFLNCYYFEYNYYYYGVSVADFVDMLLEDTVDMAVYYTVLRQKALELGCNLTDEQLADVEASMTGENQKVYEQTKVSLGLTDASMNVLATADLYRDNLMDALVPTVTDEMLSSYVYHVRHILLKTVDDNSEPLPDDEIAEKRAQAEDILARLQAVEGEELSALFDELMNQYSEDGRDEESGELYSPDGYIAVPGDMVTEFEEASLALPIGGLSGIVESVYGYHIILRDEVEDTESYAEDCRSYHLEQEMNALTEKAEVTRASALETLDVAGFYERYVAYQNAAWTNYEGAVG